jgi:putative ABC transport system permease protein
VRLALALASLRRRRTRTALAIAGVAVSAAMLLDMVMLSTGMRESFRQLLTARGFELRLSPKGTLPFDTDATIGGARSIVAELAAHPEVAAVSPVLGASVHVPLEDGAVTAIALGIDPRAQGDYELLSGVDTSGAGALVANADFLRAIGARPGDTVEVAAGYDPQLRTFTGTRRLVIAGEARFIYLAAGQLAVAMPLGTLQAMGGPERHERASLFMVRARPGADVEALRTWIEREVPQVTAVSTAGALAQMDERLSYFRQLAFILGAVSLVVGFLLVTTLVTVSVNERVGEIAVLRAIGVSRAHVVQQVLIEGLAIMLTGALAGLALGLATARYLDAILSAFPGLPRAIEFFLFQPRSAWTALGLLTVAGVLAGLYPAWRGASLPIATTLKGEAVA